MSQFFSLPVNIRQTATTAANSTIFSMRNSPSATTGIYIQSMTFLLSFDATTPATPTTFRYDLIRFSTATPTGGTALTVAQMNSGTVGTQIIDARFADTGLTTTGAVFNSPFATIGCPAVSGATVNYSTANPLILGVGEGLCIRLNVAATIGQSITGEITWGETS